MTDHGAVLDRVPTGVFIGGQWRDAAGGGRFPVEDPATQEVLLEVADGQPEDATAALDAAVAAAPEWAATAPRERGEILRRAWALLGEHAEELALVMTLEMGKSLAESRAEVAYGAEFFRWFSEEAVRVEGRFSRAPATPERLLTMKQPVGPCLLITPWNFPLAMGTRKIGPAIAAGCTMVLKPAQLTPLTSLRLAQLLAEAGLPDGVLNVVPSTSAGRTIGPLMSDPRLRKVSFTGSTEVGQALIEQSARNVLRVSMELGGNAPFLVFADADLDAAVDGAMIAKMRNNGESCVAANRFHVAAEVAEEFTARLAERMGALTVGHGADDGVQVGPLINEEQLEKVEELVADAVDTGAKALTGGRRVDGRGYFYAPTVLAGVEGKARILREEVFGPVAPVTTFETEEEALTQANATEFGLVAYVFSQDLKRALRIVEGLETGMVGLNRGLVSNAAAPFGGIKHSGIGREGGPDGIEEYLSTKYVAIDL
ncbi:MAG: succinate-semialdehyde dehydrogenase / glutarate-semialdehyde dehydrogenase [Actinomycetota bacterium]|jgi:succinate-semialdehyde dehydrogenase/glutarate-semialdehyde dehydrogenase|nr:succinate-semialdehyde dehydrogenase / glutarate-semialdehyde dehydrogenase [Actinomycetota bacterium]